MAAIDHVRKAHRVGGLLAVTYERQTDHRTRSVGRGRGAAHREQRVIETGRYHITAVVRQEARIAAQKDRFGWKGFVTNTTAQRLSLGDAVLCYRHEYRIEPIVNRLKSRLQVAPLFVKRDDQIQGLPYLLTLGVRLLTVMEFNVRRSLQQDQAKLPGLHPENRKKQTATPA